MSCEDDDVPLSGSLQALSVRTDAVLERGQNEGANPVEDHKEGEHGLGSAGLHDDGGRETFGAQVDEPVEDDVRVEALEERGSSRVKESVVKEARNEPTKA